MAKAEKILQEFGKINSVGKNFGVLKLSFNNLNIDFSLPRSDNKTTNGHKGFTVTVCADFDFKSAAKRRDFTINSIGYDPITNKILDPYNGIKDLNKRVLKAVDLKKFGEDPLRILRAVVFSSRFELKIEPKLFKLLKKLIKKNLLNELPKERIFEEIKKLLLKSKKPSVGFKLLKQISGFSFFNEFSELNKTKRNRVFNALNRAVKITHKIDNKEKLILMLALLTSQFSKEKKNSFLEKLTNQKEIIKNVKKLTSISFLLTDQTNYTIYKLSTEIKISFFTLYLFSLYPKQKKTIKELIKKAKKLKVYNSAPVPLIQGRDLIEFGMQPSQKFSLILQEIYEKQLREELKTKKDVFNFLYHSNLIK